MLPSHEEGLETDMINERDFDTNTSSAEREREARRSHRRIVFALAISAIFLLTAIHSFVLSVAAQEEEREHIMTYGMGTGVMSANPYVGIEDSDYIFYGLVYDYLMFPNEDGVPTPNLAESWWAINGTIAAAGGTDFSDPDVFPTNNTPDDWPMGSVWEYNLTDKAYWSDGEPFDAEDIVWTINIQIRGNFMTYWAYQPVTRWIHHAEEVDEYTVRLFFSEFDTLWPIPVSWGHTISVPILPQHALGSYGTAHVAQTWDGLPAIGTGPFKGTSNLEYEIIAKEQVTLVRNPYWNFTDDNGDLAGLGGVYGRECQIDRLIMKFYSEEQTLVLDLKTGVVDTAEVTPSNYLALEGQPGTSGNNLTFVHMLSSTVYSKISHWNVRTETSAASELIPARLDPALWRACAIATNKSAIVESVFKGFALPGVGINSPVWPEWYWVPGDEPCSWYLNSSDNSTTYYTYTEPMKDVMGFNLTRANEIMDAAGYEWTGTPYESPRKIGALAAQRLYDLGIVGDPALVVDTVLDFSEDDIVVQEIFEDRAIAEYLRDEWIHIGVKISPRLTTVAVWSELIYTYAFHFTETYWSGDPDPNYLMYVMTSYAIDGWNEWGVMDPLYDYYYDMQAQTLDLVERSYWVNKCLEWQYLCGHAIFTVYPELTVAYNDDWRWTNWGDWIAHPGLAMDHFWGEPPLVYTVKWLGNDTQESGDAWIYVVVALGLAALAAAAMLIMKKKKVQKMMEEEDVLEEESEEEEIK